MGIMTLRLTSMFKIWLKGGSITVWVFAQLVEVSSAKGSSEKQAIMENLRKIVFPKMQIHLINKAYTVQHCSKFLGSVKLVA